MHSLALSCLASSEMTEESGSKKCYGRARDEPDSWPDTISWKNFKGPSFAKLETCNEIIECLLESRQIDVNSYHLENEEVDEADQRDEDNQYDPPDNENQYNPPDYDNQYNPPGPDILDPTGNWRWNNEFQQWIPTQPAAQPDAVEQDLGVDGGVDDGDPFIATVQTFTM